MKNIFILLVFLICPKILFAQKCLHKNLSEKFDFEIKLTKIKIENEEIDSNSVKIIVLNKISNKKQEINYGANYFFSKTFENCNSVRSYSTGENKNAEILDNDFGYLIIADFNFDKREDFAIINDSGGNGGPTYNFYIQNENEKFILDEFLTTQMEFFPTTFKNKSNELITYVHANAYQLSKNTYKYNITTKKWKFKKHRLVSY